MQEVGNFNHHVPCPNIEGHLDNKMSSINATWNHRCTSTYGACAVFWRNDSNGFVLQDDFTIPLTDSPNFLIQVVMLKTRNGSRHVGVASVHTDKDDPQAPHARNHAYIQMKCRWPDITHYIVAGDFNDESLGGQTGLTKVQFDGWTKPGTCSAPAPQPQIDCVFRDGFTTPGTRQGNRMVIPQVLTDQKQYSDHQGLGVTLYWS